MTKFRRFGDCGFNNSKKALQTKLQKNNGSFESTETKQKRKSTNIENCGFECNFSSPATKKKAAETNLANIGVKYPAQNKQVYEKVQASKLKKYGNKVGDSRKLRLHFTPEMYEKSRTTCMLKHGVPNGGASEQAHEKMFRKYRYDGKAFDSAPELAYYIWLKDNGISFTYNGVQGLKYKYGSCEFTYFPDFKVGNQLIEIKGD